MFFKKQLFSDTQKQQIVAAIKSAEQLTSGQIKVHTEPRCKNEPLNRAAEVFNKLEMHKTVHKNGVLIYIAWQDKKFAIIGDSGINAVVPPDFWDATKEKMKQHFKRDEFLEGVIIAVRESGLHLQKYFPHQSSDTNELSDEISEG